MNIFYETNFFTKWLKNLRDIKARSRILARIDKAKIGVFGDYKNLGDGVSEMKINYGPGYRIYYAQEGLSVYLLLIGGDKSTQSKDISRAKEIWQTIKGKNNDRSEHS